ncbi:RHS repeat-associated core domain-containing protein [Ruminiclostridium hungatei]|uniref:RHS repeat-associated core domain-containing protein n=1 Tax=Ruminiclostridium hungatei TaxID=48256 RepID=UPI001054D256
MIKTSTGDITAEYAYDGNGLRTSKNINGTVTNHIWDGSQIILETSGTGEVTSKYVRGINLIYYEDGTGANRRFFLYNGHGDVVQLTDASGSSVKSYDYDAFGNEKNPDANDTNVFRYCGEYFDKETGTIYLRARYYDPMIGGFITEDSVWGKDSDPLSLNLYTYCGNNPIDYIDQTGNSPIGIDKIWTLMFGKVVGDVLSIPEKTRTAVLLAKLTPPYWAAVKATRNGDYPEAFDIGGFTRDKNGIYHAKQDALLQSKKYVGYNALYDVAFNCATNMDYKIFNFSVNEEKYRFWFWKGDYLNLGAGAEVGIYYGGGPHWLIDKNLALPMSLALYDKKGNQIFTWTPNENNWWITGFNPNYQNVRASDLVVYGNMNFSQHKDWYDNFKKTVDGSSMWEFDDKNYNARFKW